MNKTVRFKSRKDQLFTTVILGTIALLLSTIISFWIDNNSMLLSILCSLISSAVAFFLLWMFFATHYAIDEQKLHYTSGPIKGSINITDIKKLELGETKYVGLKIATARKGIVVHYSTYDELYISPTNNEAFAQALLFVNPDIDVLR